MGLTFSSPKNSTNSSSSGGGNNRDPRGESNVHSNYSKNVSAPKYSYGSNNNNNNSAAAKALKAKQAKDKADAKAASDKRAKDKAAYDKAQAAKVKAERERVAAKKIKENQKKLREYNAKQDAIEKAAAAKDKADAAKAAKEAQAAKAAKEAQAAKDAKVKADKAQAKVVEDKKAKDKAEYEKGLALSAKKAKAKRDNAAKVKAAEVDVPIGAAWENRSPQERGIDPLERMPTNDGAGMSGAGVAFYPKGYGETLEDNAPDSVLGYGRALLNPMSSIITTAGQTMLNQAKYGMNEEAANLYKAFIADPSNAGKSVEDLVQMARQPQIDRQKDNAYIGGQGGAGMSEKQLEMFRPRAISPDNWGGLTIGQKMALMGNATGDGGMAYASGGGFPNGGGGGGPASTGGNQGSGGMLTGAPVAPTAPTLGQLTTGDYTPTGRPDWAPSQSIYQAPTAPQQSFAPQWNQQPQQSAFAPQWSPQAQQPAWAPKPRSMLDAPMQLRAPPSRFLRR